MRDDAKDDASTLIVSGLGIAAIGALGAVVGGSLCPVCVVAAPAMIGVGAYRRWRASRDNSS